ncbi:MAG TPA: hypothetical protein VNE16_12925 [Vicinamibacterales bacterium]|nr:hypothetical protein [Vicinamibacterales bacterium]
MRSLKAVILATALALAVPAALHAQVDASLFTHFTWRSVGPAGAGGRIVDIAVAGTPQHIYVAAATGGLWKSDDNGVTWTPILDHEPVVSLGAVAAVDANPDVIWAGTGEANPRNSVLWGDGVYKTTNGGRTWTDMGLKDTQHISRIVIDPRHPDTVYVAALGHMWGPNKERGVYKTTDGGLTWTRSLFVDDHTGAIDLVMDPHDSLTLYAAMYQVQRDGFDGGDPAHGWGPGSGIYKTTDGGRTWKKLTHGLPSGDLGRIGLSVSRSDPSVVYAIVQTPTTVPRETDTGPAGRQTPGPKTMQDGGIFRSDNRGETWTWVNSLDQRPFYFSQIRVDPNDPNHVWAVGGNLSESFDGGRTFTSRRDNIHVDHHAFWIDPHDSRHMIDGDDGGIYLTYDGGRTWDFADQMAISQFYEVDVDNQDPYHIYGGVQDYCSWGGPSATRDQVGIMQSDWHKVMTGDGFQAHPDPVDPTTVYAESQYGGLVRHDTVSGRNTSIKPEPKKGEKPYRFNWETPYIVSKHDHRTLYLGGNFVFKSTDRGDAWTIISPELTTNKAGTISTIDESPLKAGLLYVGTDDGHVWVTRDDGQHWTDVTANVPGLPGRRWVSRVVASRFNEGTAYVAFDGHWENDFTTYLFRTTDYGKTWTSIASDLPADGPVRVIREGLKNRDLLFAGTQFAAYVSIDAGRHWERLMSGMPTVPVADLIIQPQQEDLVAATHGRSIYVLDDIEPLEELTPQVLASPVHLFTVRPAVAFDYRAYTDDQFLASKWWHGENPAPGTAISYYLKTPAAGKVTITILDRVGQVVRELKGTTDRGINRVQWDLRGAPPVRHNGGGGEGFFGALEGPLVDPGQYTARLTVDGRQLTTPVEVKADPLVRITEADRTARRAVVDRLVDVQKQADADAAKAASADRQMQALKKAVTAAPNVPAGIRRGVDRLAGEAAGLKTDLGKTNSTVLRLYREITGSPFLPTVTQRQELDEAAQDLRTHGGRLATMLSKTIPALERQMDEAHVPRVVVGKG